MEDTVQYQACNMTGTYFHNMDKKGRINFPVKLREQIGETFWVSRGTSEHCLTVYSKEGWENVMQQVAGLKGPNAEKLRRWLCSGSTEVTPDAQGRILIPLAMRIYAGLDTEDSVVVAGVGLKAEIWAKSAWEKTQESYDPSTDPILEDLCL